MIRNWAFSHLNKSTATCCHGSDDISVLMSGSLWLFRAWRAHILHCLTKDSMSVFMPGQYSWFKEIQVVSKEY